MFSGTSIGTVENGQTLTGLTITLSNITDGADELLTVDGSSVVLTNANIGTTATNTLSYAVSLSGSTATVVLSGGALSTAQAQILVDQLSYQNNSADLTVASRVATITELVDSGGIANAGDDTATLSVASTVTVQSVNNEPTLTATGNDPVFTEGGGAASLFSGTSIATVENGQSLTGLTMTLSNITDGADELLIVDGSSLVLSNASSGVTATNTLSYAVSLSGSTATLVLNGGALSPAQAQTLIDTLGYQNTSVDATVANRVVTITQLVDSGGTANAGEDTATLNVASTVTVQSVNNEPTLTTTGSNPIFTEGGAAAGLFSGTNVATVENGQTLSGLTLTLSTITDGANELLIVDGSSVELTNANSGVTTTSGLAYAVNLSGSTATVVFSGGTLSATQTQILVDALSYQNSSVNPTIADRLVTLTQIVDSGGTANSGDDTAALSIASTVTVQSVNNEPTLTIVTGDPIFTEGGVAVNPFVTSSVSTVESGQTLIGLTLTVSSVSDGADELLFIDGSSVALIDTNTGTTASNSLNYAVNLAGSTATVAITGATLSTAQTQTLINSLTYQHDGADPTIGNRIVTVTQLVDSGGTANGGDDTATLVSASTVGVQSVNDEPILITTGGPATFTEGGVAADLFSGTTVSTVESSQTLSNLTLSVSNVTDGADELITVDGSLVALTSTNSGFTATNGLSYLVSVSGSTATVVLSNGSLSASQAEVLVDTLSYQNNSVNPTIADREVRLVQLTDSGGTANGGADTAALTAVSTVTVQSVNAETDAVDDQ